MKKVILGATGSIGSSLAKKLVDSGEQVHLVGRDENSLSELAKNLNSTFSVCDVLEENFSEKILNDLNDEPINGLAFCVGSIDLKPLKLTKKSDFMQSFTQYGGARPFGTALLIAGVDEEGIHLFETDPSGAYQSYQAGAIGRGRSTVIDHFENHWKLNMTKNAAIKLGLEALKESLEDDLNRETVEIAVVDSTGYEKLDRESTLKQLDRL